jgi:hypothetical protein
VSLAICKALEKRGHRFVRYTDDCNIYVRSQRAGDRLTVGIERFLAKRFKLRVKVNKPRARWHHRACENSWALLALQSGKRSSGASRSGRSHGSRREYGKRRAAAARC